MRLLRTKLFLWICFLPLFSAAQSGDALNEYVEIALRSNLALQQKQISVENAMNSLKQARTLFLPSLDFEAIYTTAGGGRSYDMPIGDMINPYIESINQLLGSQSINLLQNEKINFLPKNYYDARVRLTAPLFNISIINYLNVQKRQFAIHEYDMVVFERELVKEIKTTYYQYLSATKAIGIYENAVALAEEGKRVSEKLVASGTGLPAYILRAETEIEQAQAKLIETRYQAKLVQRYFNFLLNRDAAEEIITPTYEQTITLPENGKVSSENREELSSLAELIELRKGMVRINQQVFVPSLSGFGDLGAQAEHMVFNKNAPYYMVGLQLSFPISNGNKNRLKVKESKNELTMTELKNEEVKQQLELAVNKAHSDVQVAFLNYKAALKQLETAETYSRLIHKGYQSGVNTYLETVDARAQLTNARLAKSINYYKVLSAMAELERETASYPIIK